MEILFEYRGSRRQLNVAGGESITRVVSSELQRIGKPRAQVFTAKDDLPSSRRGESLPDIYLLQKWSTQWECYVDVAHCNEITDGDRLAVIAKPKPTSKLFMLCCCGGDSSYRVGKVGGSGMNRVPKSEEIQYLEYRFRADSVSGFIVGDNQSIAPSESGTDLKEGEDYIRAKSGRASWKLVRSKTGDKVEEGNGGNEDLVTSPTLEEGERLEEEEEGVALEEGGEEVEEKGGKEGVALEEKGGEEGVAFEEKGGEEGVALEEKGGEEGVALEEKGGEEGVALEEKGGEEGVALEEKGGEEGVALEGGEEGDGSERSDKNLMMLSQDTTDDQNYSNQTSECENITPHQNQNQTTENDDIQSQNEIDTFNESQDEIKGTSVEDIEMTCFEDEISNQPLEIQTSAIDEVKGDIGDEEREGGVINDVIKEELEVVSMTATQDQQN